MLTHFYISIFEARSRLEWNFFGSYWMAWGTIFVAGAWPVSKKMGSGSARAIKYRLDPALMLILDFDVIMHCNHIALFFLFLAHYIAASTKCILNAWRSIEKTVQLDQRIATFSLLLVFIVHSLDWLVDGYVMLVSKREY